MRQRIDAAARIAPSPMNGNRYRSWTRVGRMKKAIARIVTPTSSACGVGRRARAMQTRTNAAASRSAPTNTAGIPANVTASGHVGFGGTGWRMTVSQAQPPFAATPVPSTEASAQGL